MAPITGINTLGIMVRQLETRFGNLRAEIDEISEEWAGIGAAGGQREDHAATLLSRLLPHLDGLSMFATRCHGQISEMVSNPFATPK